MALAAYRSLLRSTRIAFQGMLILCISLLPSESRKPTPRSYPTDLIIGDIPLLHAARAEARNSFLKNATLQPEDPALAAAIKHAEEVAIILRENVVQGEKNRGRGEEKY